MALLADDAAGVAQAIGVPSEPAAVPPGAKALAEASGGQWRHHLVPSDWKALLIVGDLLSLSTALSLSLLVLRSSGQHVEPRLGWYVALGVVWAGVATVANSHDLATASRRRASIASVHRVGLATAVLYLVCPFALPPLLASRSAALALTLGAVLFLTCWRAAYEGLVSGSRLRTRVLVVGAGWAGRAIVEAIRVLGGAYEVVGIVDRDPASWRSILAGAPVLGGLDALHRLVDDGLVDEVVVAVAGDSQAEYRAALLGCLGRGVRVTQVADLYEAITSRVLVERSDQRCLGAIPVSAGTGLLRAIFRRGLDLAFSVPGAIALALILPFVALAIRLDSPGPVFYSQERVGRHGKRFRILKLRSMREDAEASGQAVWASQGDGRVTRVGRILRRTRIDELPQFLSVLKGDMSLIGPRPERPTFVALLERRIPSYWVRHLVKPGLTGWAQVMYRYGSTVEDARVKLQYDLYYVKHESVLLDLVTILKTVGVVLRCKGT